ncbi:MAG: hypothetical protein Q4E74_01850 [Ruminococcus sp.]|nr:hypothetical protein [Ruminococcus sp.]
MCRYLIKYAYSIKYDSKSLIMFYVIALMLIGMGLFFYKSGFQRYGSKKSHRKHSEQRWVSVKADVVDRETSQRQEFSGNIGSYTAAFDELKIRWIAKDGRVYNKYIDNCDNDGYVKICYREDDPNNFYLEDFSDGLDDIEREYEGEYCHNLGTRVFTGLLTLGLGIGGVCMLIYAIRYTILYFDR